MTKAQQIFADALKLPAKTRSSLIEQLAESLHGPADPEVTKAWDKEIGRRVALDKKSQLKYISAKAAIADMRRRLKK